MLQVQILDRCPYCEGKGEVFFQVDFDTHGKPYDRYRPCSMCHGSGEYPRWISLDEFRKLLQSHCPHKHTSMIGGMHFTAGDVWDDITEVCDDCGAILEP